MSKAVHQVFGAGIQTHDILDMSLFPWALDQGFSILVQNI